MSDAREPTDPQPSPSVPDLPATESSDAEVTGGASALQSALQMEGRKFQTLADASRQANASPLGTIQNEK